MTFDRNEGRPLVTVVIPSYNHERYIRQSIESVVNQTYGNIQLIVIDDGSSDRSPEIIRGMAEEFSFEYIKQKNIGLPKTLNKAIALAKGKYFVSFGSDDIMFLDRIEKQVVFMEAHPEFKITSGNVIFVNEEGEEAVVQKPRATRILEFDDIFLNRQPGIQAAGAMVERELFSVHGEYDPDIPLEDIYMWLKLLSLGHRAYILEDNLAYYRKHSRNTYKNIPYMLDAVLKTIESYSYHSDYNAVKNRILKSHFMAASKKDGAQALAIFMRISVRYYSLKLVRGLARCGLYYAKKPYFK